MTDTGNFKYDDTTAEVFEMAKEFVAAGADPFRIAQEVYETKTIPAIKILGSALSRLKTYAHGKVGVIVISQRMLKAAKASQEETSGIVDHIRSVKGVDIAVLIRETDKGEIKVNLRSKKQDVQKIAKKFGGGGHSKASGAVLKGKLKEVKKRVVKTVLESIK
jgi:phosphoesterase RecJ-like protein